MATAAACPNCKSKTAPRSWLDLFGYECTQCSGLWIPGVTLAHFLSLHRHVSRHAELLERANSNEPSRRPLHCPTCCTASFRSLEAVGVELDICGTCGGCYLDAEEVKEFLQSGRNRKSSALGVIGVMTVTDLIFALF